MSWVTMNLRTGTNKVQINNLELRDIQYSRELRSIHRELAFNKTRLNNEQKNKEKELKEEYDAKRKERPDVKSDEYNTWATEFAEIKEDYEANKLDNDEFYESYQADLEEEATAEENFIQTQQNELEAELQAVRQELEVTKEQVGADIQSSKIKLQ